MSDHGHVHSVVARDAEASHAHEHEHEHPGGLRGLLASVLHPHSHDAAAATDHVLEASEDGMRALRVSLGGLAFTAGVQAAIFLASGSVALLADTVHNLADALTAIPLAAAFWLGRRPATDRYTYGYGRSEDLAGVFIVLAIAASSVLAAAEAVARLVHPQSVDRLGWVAAAGLVGFAGNEAVAAYRIRVGRRIGSAALEADGYHARTDGLTSLAVVLGAGGVALGWQAADPVVGLVISVAILLVLKNAARDIYRRLMDAVEPGLVEQVRAVLSGVHGVAGVGAVQIRWIGHELHGVADIDVDGGISVAQAHDIAEDAHHQLLHEVRRLKQVVIHVGPHGDPHAVTAHHR